MAEKFRWEDMYPNAEFQKKKQGVSPVLSSENIWFQGFDLAQKKSKDGGVIDTYSFDRPELPALDKRVALIIEIEQYFSDIYLGPIGRKNDNSRDYDGDKQKEERKIRDAHIDTTVTLFSEKLWVLLGWYDKLQKFSIQKGVLTVSAMIPPRKSPSLYNFNLVEIFQSKNGKFLLNEKRLVESLKNPVRESLDNLKETIDTESYFGWSVIVSFERVNNVRDISSKIAGVGWLTAMTAASFDAVRYNIGRVMFRNDAGRMQELDKSIIQQFSSYVWDKAKLNTVIFRMMAVSGRTFNVVRNSFTSLHMSAVDKSAQIITRMKYSAKKYPAISPEAFESAKTLYSKKISEAFLRQMSPAIALKSLVWLPMHYIFWWVFFKEYQKNYADSLSLYKGIAETGAFYAGAKVWASMTPGLWKPVSGMVVGWVAALWVSLVWSNEAFDKLMWKNMPGRFSGDDSKSLVTHVVTGWAINDVLDTKTKNTDIRLPGGRGGWRIYNPFGKDIVMWDIAIAQTTVDFGMNPREYLSGRIAPTDHWNNRMDEFVGTEKVSGFVVPEIQKILLDFQNEKWLFALGNIRKYDSWVDHKWVPNKQGKSFEDHDPKTLLEKRKMALRERLLPVIGWSNVNVRTRAIVADAVEYVTETISPLKNKEEQKELLEMFFRNYGNVLKIDNETLKNEEKILKNDEKYLFPLLENFASEVWWKEGNFAKHVFSRLLRGDVLVKEITEMTSGRGDSGNVRSYYNPAEKSLYGALIDDPKGLSEDQYEQMGYIDKKDHKGKTRWDYFVFLLATLVEYREQKRYIDTAKTLGYANKWSL